VVLASYAGTGHAWPVGGGATPSAATVIWDFVRPLHR
jgi:poly(3-hydroxybutyrate) depolymerase